jgi:hypothetical protein
MLHQRVHREPRMSINALSQYMTAPAARREAILREQKYPSDYRVIWYEHATRAIVRFLLDPEKDVNVLTEAAQRIRTRPEADRKEQRKLADNANALIAFAACYNQIPFDGLRVQRGPQEGNLVLEGVTISVRPEAQLVGDYRGVHSLGAVKLYLSKNNRLGTDGFATTGALLQFFMQARLPTGSTCLARHCNVVDVFGRKCVAAPRAAARRRNEVEAACREIAHRWPNIAVTGESSFAMPSVP